jgi:hypothetical protein
MSTPTRRSLLLYIVMLCVIMAVMVMVSREILQVVKVRVDANAFAFGSFLRCGHGHTAIIDKKQQKSDKK